MNRAIALLAVSLASGNMAFAAEDNAAAENEELARASNCMACHKVEARVVGPSYYEVSKKYGDQIKAAADQAAEEAAVKDLLFNKVKNGGSGVWGKVPMPANAHIKDADITRLLDWILSLRDPAQP